MFFFFFFSPRSKSFVTYFCGQLGLNICVTFIESFPFHFILLKMCMFSTVLDSGFLDIIKEEVRISFIVTYFIRG